MKLPTMYFKEEELEATAAPSGHFWFLGGGSAVAGGFVALHSESEEHFRNYLEGT